jgi:hypothetical protein
MGVLAVSARIVAPARCLRMRLPMGMVLRFMRVLLRLHQMLLQLLLGLAPPAGRIAEFPGGLGTAHFNARAS